MTTKIGAGYSDKQTPASAGREAAEKALAGAGGAADMVFTFASTNYAFDELLGAIRQVTGTAPLLGASTAGQYTESGQGQESVAVMAVRSDSMRFEVAVGKGLRASQTDAVDQAMRSFSGSYQKARDAGFAHATCFVCTDGLAGNGEDLVDAIHARTGMLAQLVGGAAADQATFERTDVFANGEHHTDAVAVAYAFSKTPIGIGVRHGLDAGSANMIVTKASGGLLEELDGKPAAQAYDTYAASIGKPLTDETRGAFMIVNNLGMLTPTGEHKIRAPLKSDENGALVMASEVPAGCSVAIMRGTPDGLIAAAEDAARDAVAGLAAARPAGILVFDCICRRIFLGARYRRQAEAARRVVGANLPLAGWETYGEIALTARQSSGWHNSTTVLAVFPE
jgi:methyl-accepting chemotaxis protein